METATLPISRVIRACGINRKATVREVEVGETPTFVQKHDKLCTGMTSFGAVPDDDWSCTFDPPVQLRGGVGYVAVFQD